jgi:hypothetical protein
MKKALISGCISDIIRNMDPDKVEEFIKALKNFTYLLNKHSPK